MKRLTLEDQRINAFLYPERVVRPKTRGECEHAARPCPYVGCRYHLYLDVNPATGNLKMNFPDREVWELEHSCALDVAEEPRTLEEIGDILRITRERVRQIERTALAVMQEEAEPEDFEGFPSDAVPVAVGALALR